MTHKLVARTQTWFNYKHHSIGEILVGIAPQGAVTFISQGWAGQVSDIHLKENGGTCFLVILFWQIENSIYIHESAGMFSAEV